jgi:predicted DNA-binding transcriptional regulator YafY
MTSSRLLTLLSLLQTRRDWPGGELAERLEVSRRTIRRDVERLRALGYPVESLTGPAGGYRLAAGTAMPPLLLDDDEAIAIAVGLRTAARSSVAGIEETSVRALVKLEQVLPAHLRSRVSALGATTMSLPPAGPTVDPQCLTVLAGGCRDNECVRFGYTARDGEFARRDVEPHSLVNRGRRWYLVCWDRGRDDWRTFRVDRITEPAPLGVRFTPRPLPARDAAEFVEQRFRALPSRYEARLTLHASADAVHVPAGWGTVAPIDERTCEYRSGDDNLEWLAMRVAMLGVEFEVHEPPELAQELRALADRLSRGARRSPRSSRPAGASAASRRRG